jgi:hypothetical protein
MSLARCLRRMALFLSASMPLLTGLSHNMLRGFLVDGLNGALVGKRLEAIRSPSARRSCMMSALYRIFPPRGVVCCSLGWRDRVGWGLKCGEEFGEICMYAGG